MFRTARDSMGARMRKQMLAKSSWYKGAKKRDWYGKQKKGSKETIKQEERVTQQSLLFVEHTHNGELAKRLRELMQRIGP